MKGVILAAGDGGRLRPLTLRTPKVLLEIDGRPLIHYVVEALTSAGVSDIGVVVGDRAETVSDALTESFPDLTFIYNRHYDGGNAVSVHAARSFVLDEPFVLCMGDHLIGHEMVRRLVSVRRNWTTLGVDLEAWHLSQLNDATRVLVDSSGHVADIGKKLKVWDAIDTGLFWMTREFLVAIDRLMETRGVQVEISDVVRHLGARGRPLATCDMSGIFWADVDTREDYEAIDRLLRERHGELV